MADKGTFRSKMGDTDQGMKPSDAVRPMRRTIAGRRVLIFPGSGIVELDNASGGNDDVSKVLEKHEKLLKDIVKQLKGSNKPNGGKGGKGGGGNGGGDGESMSALGAFAGSLKGDIPTLAELGNKLKDVVSPVTDALNPMTYVNMIPGGESLADATKAGLSQARENLRGKDPEKEDKEDDEVQEEQLDTSKTILETLQPFDKLVSLTETIQETLLQIKEQGADAKLKAREAKNEAKGKGGLVGAGGVGGVGAMGGGGDTPEHDSSNVASDLIDATGDVVETALIARMFGGGKGGKGSLIGRLLRKIPGAKKVATAGSALLAARNFIPGLGASRRTAQTAASTASMGMNAIKNPTLDAMFKQQKLINKSMQSSSKTAKLLKNASKLRHLGKLKALAGGPAGAILLTAELGVDSYIRQTEAKSKGLEASLGEGTDLSDPDLQIDRKTGLTKVDKKAERDAMTKLGIDPDSQKAGRIRRQMRGKNSLKINEKSIEMAIDEAMKLREAGEDQQANEKMAEATQLMKDRKRIVQGMGFLDHEKAANAYQMVHSNIGSRIANLGGMDNWNMFEQEDRGFFRRLDSAFNTIGSSATTVGLGAREAEELRIESRSRQSGPMLQQTTSNLHNTSSGGAGGGSLVNAPTTNNNSTVNNTTSVSGVQSTSNSEDAYRQEENSQRNNNVW